MRTISQQGLGTILYPDAAAFTQDENYFAVTPSTSHAAYAVADITYQSENATVQFNVADGETSRCYINDIMRSIIAAYDNDYAVYPAGSQQSYAITVVLTVYDSSDQAVGTQVNFGFILLHGRTLAHRIHGSQTRYRMPYETTIWRPYFPTAQTAHLLQFVRDMQQSAWTDTEVVVRNQGLGTAAIAGSQRPYLINIQDSGYKYGEAWALHEVGTVATDIQGTSYNNAYRRDFDFFKCADAVVKYYNTDGELCYLDGKVIGKTTTAGGIEYPYRAGNAINRSRARIVADRGCEVEVAFEGLHREMYAEDLLLSDFVWLNDVLVIPTTTQMTRGDRDYYDTEITFKFAEQ